MRYRVELVNRPAVIVEAQEFGSRENGIIFYSMRHRAREGRNDQWGNPMMQRMQVPVAFFSNVASITEIPEGEAPGIPQARAVNITHNPMGTNMWYEEAPVDIPEHPALIGRGIQPIPVDADGINWDAAREE